MPPRFTTLALSLAIMFSGCATSSAPGAGGLLPVARDIPPMPIGVYDVARVSSPPRPISQSAPRYPSDLRAAGITGEATIHFIVDRNGDVVMPTVVRADDARFGEAACAAIATWRFQPARVNGQPVDCAMMLPIVFSVER